MTEDMFREIDAMRKVAEALASLDKDEVARVLEWAVSKFGVEIADQPVSQQSDSMPPPVNSQNSDTDINFETLAELFAAASPSTDAEKVLVVAYWHQYVLNEPSLTSYYINKDLKDLGHGVKRMNDAWDRLMAEKPHLVVQLKKTGSSTQARRIFKLTNAGKQRVEDMLRGS